MSLYKNSRYSNIIVYGVFERLLLPSSVTYDHGTIGYHPKFVSVGYLYFCFFYCILYYYYNIIRRNKTSAIDISVYYDISPVIYVCIDHTVHFIYIITLLKYSTWFYDIYNSLLYIMYHVYKYICASFFFFHSSSLFLIIYFVFYYYIIVQYIFY